MLRNCFFHRQWLRFSRGWVRKDGNLLTETGRTHTQVYILCSCNDNIILCIYRCICMYICICSCNNSNNDKPGPPPRRTPGATRSTRWPRTDLKSDIYKMTYIYIYIYIKCTYIKHIYNMPLLTLNILTLYIYIYMFTMSGYSKSYRIILIFIFKLSTKWPRTSGGGSEALCNHINNIV